MKKPNYRFTKSLTTVLILILLNCFAVLPQASAEEPQLEFLIYDGTLGSSPIRMVLNIKTTEISGVYFHVGEQKDLDLKGSLDNQRGIKINEYDQAGKVIATFVGSFPKKDPKGNFGDSELEREVIAGNWSKADGSNPTPFYLSSTSSTTANKLGHGFYEVAGVKDDLLLESNARKFRDAVLAGNKEAVADLIDYPVTVNSKGKSTKIRNRAALIAAYDKIFTAKYIENIKEAVPHYMFARDQGVMLNDVWFGEKYKVITLNVTE